ncbi:MAG: PhzF family phenazine biosynthesis protein [Actinobacteria bacterium]|nr:PhzF family phenazine biosynthesis protein [Actinomycetota bacterium]MCL5882428.1 PhzF family phenazine biosynthesis protein [Actinomycetota bacterium]
MNFPYFHIDAFTSSIFAGNPAGVCFLEIWPPDTVLHSMAAENRLSETAFLVPSPTGNSNHYDLRWFSPVMEIDLCGHATLAGAHAVFQYIEPDADRVDFDTKSGGLSVVRREDLLIMNFPSRPARPCQPPAELAAILGAGPAETLCSSRDLMVVFEDEEQIRTLKPDCSRLAGLDYFAVIVTAPGVESDFVSRFFAPRAGIAEDPVTGSAHSTLIPYWAARLGKKELYARQLSARGGELFCAAMEERVAIGGRAVTYLTGTITI